MATPPEEKRGALTPAMRRVIVAVAALILLGLIVTAWLLFMPADRGIRDEPATPVPSAPTQGPVPGATATTGSEVMPLPDEESGGIRLPSLAPAAPLITGPFPEAGARENGLVDGFPVDAMGTIPGSDVLHSSIAVEGGTMQASLVARTDASPADVKAHYEATWTALGLTKTADSTDDTLSYAGPYESVTLTFSPSSGTGTVYTVYGVFRAG